MRTVHCQLCFPGLYLEVSGNVDARQNADGRGEEDGKHPEEVVAFTPEVRHQVVAEDLTWDNDDKTLTKFFLGVLVVIGPLVM